MAVVLPLAFAARAKLGGAPKVLSPASSSVSSIVSCSMRGPPCSVVDFLARDSGTVVPSSLTIAVERKER